MHTVISNGKNGEHATPADLVACGQSIESAMARLGDTPSAARVVEAVGVIAGNEAASFHVTYRSLRTLTRHVATACYSSDEFASIRDRAAVELVREPVRSGPPEYSHRPAPTIWDHYRELVDVARFRLSQLPGVGDVEPVPEPRTFQILRDEAFARWRASQPDPAAEREKAIDAAMKAFELEPTASRMMEALVVIAAGNHAHARWASDPIYTLCGRLPTSHYAATELQAVMAQAEKNVEHIPACFDRSTAGYDAPGKIRAAYKQFIVTAKSLAEVTGVASVEDSPRDVASQASEVDEPCVVSALGIFDAGQMPPRPKLD